MRSEDGEKEDGGKEDGGREWRERKWRERMAGNKMAGKYFFSCIKQQWLYRIYKALLNINPYEAQNKFSSRIKEIKYKENTKNKITTDNLTETKRS